ncbi:MAG: Ni/Fe hydrogenase subunit alpha [Deltaproteobacteria bacterium]|nr:Ni/Fe hydrogenase subunit alpha [Deltaproteobacteria bacterium]
MHKSHGINVNEVTRVEGHGNIVINIKKGRIEELRLEIIESPRFFEAMLRGRRYDEAHHIMSRICGICAVSHTSASLKAIESAMGITISPQAMLLRKLAFCGETLQSHMLHLYFLVLPDFFGEGSIVPLMKSHRDMAAMGLGLKNLANEICAVVGGRHVHPISLVPGGVTHAPKRDELEKLRDRLAGSFKQLDRTLGLFSSFPVPEFRKDREFISLKARKGYAFYDGSPFSSKKDSIRPETYAKKIKEYAVPHSAAKHARTSRGTFMVGALARVNNNYSRLAPSAKKAAGRLGLKPLSTNPFMNNHAQIIECFHATEEAIGMITALLLTGPKPEGIGKPKGFGTGIGLVEAPRGTLYHEYAITKDGLVEKANCIIPTAQNLRSIEDDLRHYVPTILDRPKKEITAAVETLVRAYDPCISCATHIMNVKFV